MAPRLASIRVLTLAATLIGGCDFLQVPDFPATGTGRLIVDPREGLQTTEAGGTAIFTVALGARPESEVTLSLTSNAATEGTVSPANLTFTPTNWNAPQTVTVTGVDDEVKDGDVTFVIAFGRLQSSDKAFSGVQPEPLVVANLDDETAGLFVDAANDLTTTEAGGSATFAVRLRSAPLADVRVPLTSSNAAEGRVSPETLTFTPINWNAPQQATVSGVDDAVADGPQDYTVAIGPTESADATYSTITAEPVSFKNVDDETAGVTVTPTSGIATTEVGGTATFTIVLNSQPTADVTIALSSSNVTEGTPSAASVTFTPVNWNAPQEITITGHDDSVADGNQPYAIVTAAAESADPNYAGIDPPDVVLTNTDDETAGISVAPTAGLSTTEAGGTATFTIRLNSEPTADVSVGLSSGNTAEGTVSPASVQFTAANWNAPQTVTVTGLDDAVADGNQTFDIVTTPAVSADLKYSGIDPPNVAVSNIDNDSAGFIVAPTSGLTTSEAGTTATFTVMLTSQPLADVVIGVTSSRTSEATVSTATLTFTPANWNTNQTVTVRGVDDLVADGNQLFTAVLAPATSDDPKYQALDPADVTGTNNDNDSAGITVTPTSGLRTTEVGGTATFTIQLNSQPTGNVTISLSVSDTTEAQLSTPTVAFTPANWSTPQTVTAIGLDDLVADGDQPYTIETAPAVSTDGTYNGRDAANVTATNADNDAAGITVNPTSGLQTSEAGASATFSVVLQSQPTANVTVALSSNDTTEGTVSPTSVTFTSANWNAPQVVTVAGVNDAIDDGDQGYTIVTAAAVSTDATYGGRNAADVSVTNIDNDAAAVTVLPTSGLQTTEANGTDTFTVVLTSEPTANVTIELASSNAEASVSATITFTSSNWNQAQTVTVTGLDDAVADGDQAYTIITTAASADATYNGIAAPDVTGTNADNDSAGITVAPTTGLQTAPGGGTASFEVVLTSQPTASVVVPVASGNVNEGLVSTGGGEPAPSIELTFTTSNWNVAQTVTVTGVADGIGGEVAYAIVTSAATSSDPVYGGMNADDVGVTNTEAVPTP